MSRNMVSKDAIWKVMHCVNESSSLTQGLRRELFRTITSKEEHAPQRIWRRKGFLLAFHNQGGADQASWMPCCCPHGPRTFSSGWIWIKTPSPMLQTESSSLLPPTHECYQASPKAGTTSTDLIWYSMSSGTDCTTLIIMPRNSICFLGATISTSLRHLELRNFYKGDSRGFCGCL